ncbi:hypothetical protein HOLleu_01312 [Holothuria leucospilota]|uniref:Uncharacterized protein n=1 Tax=Holothuria leucospilota TaxID=206669 RepID=A0A9Q1HKV5_HOLLE|nr:hypothetical protein HOLleu_01312 [Holothuria leucospilota]
MKKHVKRVHVTPNFQCVLCDKKFKTHSNRKKHIERCFKKQKKESEAKTSHSKSRKRKRSGPSSEESPLKKKLKVHAEDAPMRDVASKSRQTVPMRDIPKHSDLWTRNAGVAAEHLNEDPISMPEAVGNQIPENFQPVYRDNWRAVRTHHHRGNRVQGMYNFRITDLSDASMGNLVELVYHDQSDDLQLVEKFTTYCMEISQAAFQRVSVTGSIAMAIDTLKGMIVNEERLVEHIDEAVEHRYLNNVLKPTMGSLLNYCRQIPVIGFNSGRYDINVMKGLLYKSIHKLNEGDDNDMSPITQIIKRNSDYMCISSKWFKFLDIKNYLAPGCSYKQFLEAYKCKEAKGFFPYDWMDSLDKLSEPSLPPHKHFIIDSKLVILPTKSIFIAKHCGKTFIWRRLEII